MNRIERLKKFLRCLTFLQDLQCINSTFSKQWIHVF